MKHTATLTVAALLCGTTAMASSGLDSSQIAAEVQADLAQSYDLSQFDEIRVRIGRNEIEVEADGNAIDVDRTYAISSGRLGALLDADEDIYTRSGEIEREYVDGSWVESFDAYDDDDDYDEREWSRDYDDDDYDDRYQDHDEDRYADNRDWDRDDYDDSDRDWDRDDRDWDRDDRGGRGDDRGYDDD